MHDGDVPLSGSEPHRPTPERVRKRRYFALMGTCLTLIVLSWVVLPHWSVKASIVCSVVAMILPPIAAIVANWNTGFGPEDTYSGSAEAPGTRPAAPEGPAGPPASSGPSGPADPARSGGPAAPPGRGPAGGSGAGLGGGAGGRGTPPAPVPGLPPPRRSGENRRDRSQGG